MVPAGKRNEAKTEFIQNARKLLIHTLKKTKNWPKSYTFVLKNPICQLALEVYKDAARGNAVLVKSREDAQTRRAYFMRVYSNLCAMDGLIEIAQNVIGFEPDSLEYWADILLMEKKLIKGVLESDLKRYGEL